VRASSWAVYYKAYYSLERIAIIGSAVITSWNSNICVDTSSMRVARVRGTSITIITRNVCEDTSLDRITGVYSAVRVIIAEIANVGVVTSRVWDASVYSTVITVIAIGRWISRKGTIALMNCYCYKYK
jgi:hypothetical protein